MKLSAVVDSNRLWCAADADYLRQRHRDLLAAQCRISMKRQALSRELINHRQHADPSSIRQPLGE